MAYEHVDPHLGVKVGECEKGKPYCNEESLKASDELFRKLTLEARKRKIRVILDGVFNHCGSSHRWFNRDGYYDGVLGAYQSKDSKYVKYFRFLTDNWPNNDSYEAWWGIKTLPKLNYENSYELFEYVQDVAAQWLSRGALGWRLDVAPELGHSQEFNIFFWNRFRSVAKERHPNAYIVAEAYGRFEEWFKARAWDSVMNYQAFFEPVSWFFTGLDRHSSQAKPRLRNNSEAFIKTMVIESSFLPWPALTCAMNQLSNHDHSRFLTRTSGIVDLGIDSTRPAHRAYENVNKGTFKIATLFMMMWPGTPTIYYGDEVGLGGFSDPDNRRPFPWDNIDEELLSFHKDLIRLRRRLNLKNCSVNFLQAGEGYLIFSRFRHALSGDRGIIVVVNNNPHSKKVRLSLSFFDNPNPKVQIVFKVDAESHSLMSEPLYVGDGVVEFEVPPYGGEVLELQ